MNSIYLWFEVLECILSLPGQGCWCVLVEHVCPYTRLATGARLIIALQTIDAQD